MIPTHNVTTPSPAPSLLEDRRRQRRNTTNRGFLIYAGLLATACLCLAALSWNRAKMYEKPKPEFDPTKGFKCKNCNKWHCAYRPDGTLDESIFTAKGYNVLTNAQQENLKKKKCCVETKCTSAETK